MNNPRVYQVVCSLLYPRPLKKGSFRQARGLDGVVILAVCYNYSLVPNSSQGGNSARRASLTQVGNHHIIIAWKIC